MDTAQEYFKKQVRLEKIRIQKANEKQQKAIDNGLFPRDFSMPLSLQYELTGRCNCRCRHCYNKSGDLPPDAMTTQRWKDLSKEIVSHGGLFECILSGGEPLLLGDDLFEIMDIFHNDGTVFMIISNGLLMTQEKVKRLQKYRYRWIQISIDGSTTDLHDDLRQTAGCFQKATSAALMIADAGLPLAIAHTVTPKSLSDIRDMVKLAYSLGAHTFITGEVFPSGRGAINQDLLLTNEMRGEFWQTISELQKEYATRMDIQRSMTNRNQLEAVKNMPITGAIIRPNGNIRLDCIAPFVIGNVTNASFLEQWKKARGCWQNPKVQEYINSIDEYNSKSFLLTNHVDKDIIL